MRTFENKQTSIDEPQLDGSVLTLTYYHLVKTCIDRIPQGGLVTSEQKKRLDVLCLISDKIKVGEKVDIEGDVYETLKKCVVNFGWSAMHQDLIDFEKYIVELKEIFLIDLAKKLMLLPAESFI